MAASALSPSRAAVLGLATVVAACQLQEGADLPDPVPEVTPEAIELLDVALAWPLPEAGADRSSFVTPTLPCEQIQIFEPLTRTDTPEVLCENLVVTAARFDLCGRLGGEFAPCVPEVRLVVQPVIDGVARDAALHFFYAADPDVVADATLAMARLRTAHEIAGGPVRLHPLLTTEDGRRVVRDIVNDAVAQSRISHFTQITVHGDNTAWTFEFREFVDGAPVEGEARLQHVLSQTATPINVSVSPPVEADSFALLLQGDAMADADVDDVQAAYDRAAKIEHPRYHDPGTIDCASCHLAAPARAAAEKLHELKSSPDAFTSARHDLSASDVYDDARFIHAFAWRELTLSINPRVVHEAARSADLADAALRDHGVLK